MMDQGFVWLSVFQWLQEDNVSTAEEIDGSHRAPDGTSPTGGLLSVTIHSAEELEGKHHTNPYVEVHFRGEKQKTQVSLLSLVSERFFMLSESPVAMFCTH